MPRTSWRYDFILAAKPVCKVYCYELDEGQTPPYPPTISQKEMHPRIAIHLLQYCTSTELGLVRHDQNMTVLLKNLFTVHFQFDLLKLETNNTRDDKVNHAWIIAR